MELQEHLRGIVEKKPYNNIEPLFQLAGRNTFQFGGSCLQQLDALSANLIQNNHGKLRFLTNQGPNVHCVGILEEKGGQYLFDTAFRQKDMVNIADLKPGVAHRVGAYPSMENAQGSLELIVDDQGMLTERLHLEEGQSSRTQKNETFLLQNISNEHPSLEVDIATATRDRLTRMMACDAQSGSLICITQKLDGKMFSQTIPGRRQFEGTEEFDRQIETVAAMCDASKKQLLDYIREGTQLLNEYISQQLAAQTME